MFLACDVCGQGSLDVYAQTAASMTRLQIRGKKMHTCKIKSVDSIKLAKVNLSVSYNILALRLSSKVFDEGLSFEMLVTIKSICACLSECRIFTVYGHSPFL